MNVTRCPLCGEGRASAVGNVVRCYGCGLRFLVEGGVDIPEPYEDLCGHTFAVEPVASPTLQQIQDDIREVEQRIYRAMAIPRDLLGEPGALHGANVSMALLYGKGPFRARYGLD